MPKSNISNEQLEELVENLRGSNKSIEEALLDEFGIEGDCLSRTQHKTLKEEIFRCETCDYWFSKEEAVISTSHQQVCEGCTPSNFSEDDD